MPYRFNKTFFGKLNKILKLTHYFPDVDRELIVLSFTNNQHHLEPTIRRVIEERYERPVAFNYQVLEFYGDAVLHMILTELLVKVNGLRSTPGRLTQIRTALETNAFLRNLSHSIKLCDTAYKVTMKTHMNKHNVCSDSLEALIGALYYQYGLAKVATITNWFVNTFPTIIDDVNEIYEGPKRSIQAGLKLGRLRKTSEPSLRRRLKLPHRVPFQQIERVDRPVPKLPSRAQVDQFDLYMGIPHTISNLSTRSAHSRLKLPLPKGVRRELRYRVSARDGEQITTMDLGELDRTEPSTHLNPDSLPESAKRIYKWVGDGLFIEPNRLKSLIQIAYPESKTKNTEHLVVRALGFKPIGNYYWLNPKGGDRS